MFIVNFFVYTQVIIPIVCLDLWRILNLIRNISFKRKTGFTVDYTINFTERLIYTVQA